MVIQLTHAEAERACELADMCAKSNPRSKYNLEITTGGVVCIFKSSEEDCLYVSYMESPEAITWSHQAFGPLEEMKAFLRAKVPPAPHVYDSIW